MESLNIGAELPKGMISGQLLGHLGAKFEGAEVKGVLLEGFLGRLEGLGCLGLGQASVVALVVGAEQVDYLDAGGDDLLLHGRIRVGQLLVLLVNLANALYRLVSRLVVRVGAGLWLDAGVKARLTDGEARLPATRRVGRLKQQAELRMWFEVIAGPSRGVLVMTLCVKGRGGLLGGGAPAWAQVVYQ